MSLVCRVCGNNKENSSILAREMMFGTRKEFDYLECSDCGTLQICTVPDLSCHYPPGYLSFDSEALIGRTAIQRMAVPLVGKYLLTGKNLIGKWILQRRPWLEGYFPESLRKFPIGLRFDSRILDFGCGTGSLLQSLHYFGFRDLTGADAFIEKDIFYPTGVKIYKLGLDELEPAFDVIMLHHSFEHLPDPAGALEQIRRLMRPESRCIIRIPVINYAWEKYGANWVQMDPPRHLFLYSEKAFRGLAEKAGLSIEHVYFDSSAFQFWGSEQYKLDIPLTDERSRWMNGAGPFTDSQIDSWTVEAEQLNRKNRGDMACFYLRKD